MTKKNTLTLVLLLCITAASSAAQYQNPTRDKIEQPEKIMEVTGVKPGMVIGEVGAGHGYFTFWLSRGVGENGKIYANDIDSSGLSAIERRCADEKATLWANVLLDG